MEVDKPSPVTGVLSEVAAMYQPYIEKIYSCDLERLLEGIRDIKNLVIGNNKRKTNFIVLGAATRLLYLLQDSEISLQVKIQAMIVLGSLAKGIDTNVQSLLDQSIVETVCKCLSTENLELYEAAIRCLRTIVAFADNAGRVLNFDYSSVIPILLQNINRSTCTQECACEILWHYCKSREHQDHLLSLDILTILANLLEVSAGRVKIKALLSLTVVCHKNKIACEKCRFAHGKNSGKVIIEILVGLLAQKEPNEIQLYSARCLSYMFRVDMLSMSSCNAVVVQKVVPCLVRMCDPIRTFQERIDAAETIAYLIEVDPPLQRLAYICEQFPLKLESYFKHPVIKDLKNPAEMSKFKDAMKHEQSLANAGFLAYASLLSDDEDIRKQVATETLVNHVSETIVSSNSATRIAALRCLLSLSRSIHLLRTMIEDAGVWKVILKLVTNPVHEVEEQKVLSSIVCNMTLDVSPSKNEFQSAGLLNILVKWIDVDELKLNAIWCLMNMSFQAELSLKMEILDKLGFELVRNLATDRDHMIILRTLGVLRNICYHAEDRILSCHGIDILQTCKHVLTTFATAGIGDPTSCAQFEHIRAHTVCILSCLACSEEHNYVQECLQSELELLKQVISFLSHFDLDLQLATVTFLNNFITSPVASIDVRQTLLIENGALVGLRQLHSTNDAALYEKVEDTLQRLHNKQC